jgi:hypothetical protein
VSAKLILPNAGSRVRLRAADRDCLVDVAATREGAVTLTLALGDDSGGPAQILFSSPRGVVALRGDLEPGEEQATLVVRDQEWLDQRRETFRLAVGCEMTLTRGDGSTFEWTVTDL